MRKLLVLLLCAGVATFALAGFSKVGTVAATFLKIGVGRPTGMGEAFVAVADDASATFWNPAGLARLQNRSVFVDHIEWFGGINHEYISGVMPLAAGTFAVSVTAVTLDTITQTLVDDPKTPGREDEGIGVGIGAADFAFGVSYGRLITEKLAFGFTAKLVEERLWDMSASSVAADIGLLYHTGFKSLRLGVAMTNFGTYMAFTGGHLGFVDTSQAIKPIAEYKTTPAPLPTSFRFGIAYDPISTASNRLTTALDITHPNDINETINVGLEYALGNFFFLRGGYILNVDPDYAAEVGWDQGICGGMGLQVKLPPPMKLALDYSYRDLGLLPSAHRVMLNLTF